MKNNGRVIGKKTKFIIGASVAILALLIAAGLVSTSSPVAPPGTARDPFRNPATAPSGSSFGQELSAKEKRRVFETFMQWAAYPPDSRPLTGDYIDIINHQTIPIPFREMRVIDDNNKTKKSEYHCRMQPTVYNITEGMPFLVTVECTEDWKKNKERARLTLIEKRIQIVIPGKERDVPSNAITFNDGGTDGDLKAGDQIYTMRYIPTKQDWGTLNAHLKFRIENDSVGGEYTMIQSGFSSPVAPATFTDQISEELKDGSLVLRVDVDVRMPGRYDIYGNLKGANGDWIAVAHFRGKLKQGRQSVPLSFYGRIFHEREAVSPFTLVGLRGTRDNQPIDLDIVELGPAAVMKAMKTAKSTEPDRQVMPVMEPDYRTRSYDIANFTRKEYDSPEKQDRIQKYISAGYATEKDR